MNEDAYAECLVKRKDPAYAFPAKAGITVLLVIALLTAFVSLLGLVLLAAVGVAAYFVHTGLSVEYEYLFVEGDLSIDRILAKSRRKKVLECGKDEIQIVAPSDSYMLKDYEKSGMKVKDCSSGTGAKTYSLIYQQGADCVKVIFEPNDRILRSMRNYIPRKVIRGEN